MWWNKLRKQIYYLMQLPLLWAIVIFTKKKHDTLIWGIVPIISNKYWSEAMQQMGYKSKTLMITYYAINKKEDYDLYLDELVPNFIRSKKNRELLKNLFGFYYIIKNASVVHFSFDSGLLRHTFYWKLEAKLYRRAGIKVIVLPFGADSYRYSRVADLSLRHVLLTCYPHKAREEELIQKRVTYWTKWADVTFAGFSLQDGFGRNDVCIYNFFVINTKKWVQKPSANYSDKDGKNGIVKIIHTPNHRGGKGTEFIIDAIERLKKEGLLVELILLEKRSNEEVRQYMQEADILAEQIIATAYSLSGIEGMASGLPVIANLEKKDFLTIYRRYSFLNECPVVSASPETIYEVIKKLVISPQLRKELGLKGRLYVEKYHSYITAQYLFGNIYENILEGKENNLIDLFHPLKTKYDSYYNNRLSEKYKK